MKERKPLIRAFALPYRAAKTKPEKSEALGLFSLFLEGVYNAVTLQNNNNRYLTFLGARVILERMYTER
jgi:hypothetical protein